MAKERYAVIPAVYLLIKDSAGKTLFLRRHLTGYMDEHFSLVAGHVEQGESPIVAAVREAQEEVDLTLNVADLHVVHTCYRPQVGRVDFFIQVDAWTGEPRIMETNKCDELRWSAEAPDESIPGLVPVLQAIEASQNFSTRTD